MSYELYHHGIKNQKWGVRRWQNTDGSLTPEGYPHYGYKGPRNAWKAKKTVGNNVDRFKENYTNDTLARAKRANDIVNDQLNKASTNKQFQKEFFRDVESYFNVPKNGIWEPDDWDRKGYETDFIRDVDTYLERYVPNKSVYDKAMKEYGDIRDPNMKTFPNPNNERKDEITNNVVDIYKNNGLDPENPRVKKKIDKQVNDILDSTNKALRDYDYEHGYYTFEANKKRCPEWNDLVNRYNRTGNFYD